MNPLILYVSGMLIPLTYILLYILGGALRPGYNHIFHSVSELLSPGAPNKQLLVVIQTIYALLHVLFGIGVWQFVRASEPVLPVGSLGAALIAAVGVATVGTAIFPQDAEGAPPTPAGNLHKALVFGALVPFSILSTLLVGLWFRRTGIDPRFATYSFISVGAIVLTGGFGGATVGTRIMGLGERVAAIVVHQWLFALTLTLLLRS